ncbi:CLUMA_CG021070, isoform A [Clunio marinus]|uniref:CLUMA_CG021070, isoform A n=1 Tax=Clunio marinus TaxID=568069 RepID=A0A1J1J851_9DIPT|nr:CLUMA_CG021070, isoform A [Clunio marinus]
MKRNENNENKAGMDLVERNEANKEKRCVCDLLKLNLFGFCFGISNASGCGTKSETWESQEKVLKEVKRCFRKQLFKEEEIKNNPNSEAVSSVQIDKSETDEIFRWFFFWALNHVLSFV